MNLVYFAVGFNDEYIQLLYIAIKSLRKRNSVDVMVICDESLVEKCSETLKEFSNINIVSCENSTNPTNSSMKKLQIFNYDLSKYSKILFIDSDILIGRTLDHFFNGITENKLYAGEEINNISSRIDLHKCQWHSFLNYTNLAFKFFAENKIRPFNCGFFGFLNNSVMKEHFGNIIEMIKTHTGHFHYEQSFMNVYFNIRNLADTKVINASNYKLGFFEIDRPSLDLPFLNSSWTKRWYKNKVIHFAYCTGSSEKLEHMTKYWKLFVE